MHPHPRWMHENKIGQDTKETGAFQGGSHVSLEVVQEVFEDLPDDFQVFLQGFHGPHRSFCRGTPSCLCFYSRKVGNWQKPVLHSKMDRFYFHGRKSRGSQVRALIAAQLRIKGATFYPTHPPTAFQRKDTLSVLTLSSERRPRPKQQNIQTFLSMQTSSTATNCTLPEGKHTKP